MIVAGNFKTNHTRSSTLAYCRGLDQFLKTQIGVQTYLFAPSLALPYNDFAYFELGIENAYPVISGAYTGEIGWEQIEELKIRTLMIGHSERRTLFQEDHKLCKEKFDFFMHKKMTIFLCVGEDRTTRKESKIKEFLAQQLKGLDLSYSRLIVAYEPLWAIGTGVSANLEEIAQTHQILKDLGCNRVVYGGSVSSKNAREIMQLDEVDGVLVGGASLKLEDFCEIIRFGANA